MCELQFISITMLGAVRKLAGAGAAPLGRSRTELFPSLISCSPKSVRRSRQGGLAGSARAFALRSTHQCRRLTIGERRLSPLPDRPRGAKNQPRETGRRLSQDQPFARHYPPTNVPENSLAKASASLLALNSTRSTASSALPVETRLVGFIPREFNQRRISSRRMATSLGAILTSAVGIGLPIVAQR